MILLLRCGCGAVGWDGMEGEGFGLVGLSGRREGGKRKGERV